MHQSCELVCWPPRDGVAKQQKLVDAHPASLRGIADARRFFGGAAEQDCRAGPVGRMALSGSTGPRQQEFPTETSRKLFFNPETAFQDIEWRVCSLAYGF